MADGKTFNSAVAVSGKPDKSDKPVVDPASELKLVVAQELKKGDVIALKGRVCTIIDIKRNHLHTRYNITGVDSDSRKVNDVFTHTHAFQRLPPLAPRAK